MSDRKYTIPNLDGWTFKKSDAYGAYLWSPGGAGIPFVSAMTATYIADSVKNILRQSVLEPDFEAEDAAAQAIMNVDWQAMMHPPDTLVAPLLNAVPVAAVRKEDNAALVQMIHALVNELAA